MGVCNGSFLRFHTDGYQSITFGKFQTESIFGNILSIEKIANNNFKFYLVQPIIIGVDDAFFYNRIVDTSEINKKIVKYASCEDCEYHSYTYVAKDIDFGDDDMSIYFCNWYKNNS